MLVTTFGVLFLVVPPVNYIRALLAIRRHNAQLGDAVTLQMSVVLQREKRVALDTCIVAGLLFASLPPAFGMSIVQKRYPRLHSVLLPWSLTMTFIPSCANPVIYFVRFKNMRNAFKSYYQHIMERLSQSPISRRLFYILNTFITTPTWPLHVKANYMDSIMCTCV